MIVAIHQPEHLPWLGFFDKLRAADRFVILDTVGYRKNYFQNRNRIRTAGGTAWLTVPVQTSGRLGQPIRDVVIDNAGNPRWRQKCWGTLSQAYRRAPFWREHEDVLSATYARDWERLADLNLHLIRHLAAALGIETPLVFASELGASGDRSDLLLDICRRAGATTYLSGISGREYLDTKRFEDAGIAVTYQEFHHPVYTQLSEPFEPCMSAIDLLAVHGPAAADILRGVGVPTLERVFE